MITIFDLDGTDLGTKLRKIMLSWPGDKPEEYLIYVEVCLKNNKILKIPKTIKLKSIKDNTENVAKKTAINKINSLYSKYIK